MRLPNLKFEDVNLLKMFGALTSVLSNLSQDNFVTASIEGTTEGTPDTAAKFRHNLGGVPSFWHIEGNVYIPLDGIGPKEIDIRSVNASEKFRIKLVR